MDYPSFFDQAPTITVRDPLSEFLGSFAGGVVEYRYLDAVKLSGHSCPTVAGAYLMTLKALKALYGDETPERGAIRVFFPDDLDAGVTGVMAQVTTLITGAAGEGGFKGIGPNFDRSGLLNFGGGGACEIAFERTDTGKRVETAFNASMVPMADEARMLLGRLIAGQASAGESARFGELWQDRVRRLMIDHGDDPALVAIRLC
ncbi:MAG: hypothetical protein KDJ46_07370 [Rhodobiaceae bacterium]|nr:hypothetical protein [Rhodobiaceae bacterium]